MWWARARKGKCNITAWEDFTETKSRRSRALEGEKILWCDNFEERKYIDSPKYTERKTVQSCTQGKFIEEGGRGSSSKCAEKSFWLNWIWSVSQVQNSVSQSAPDGDFPEPRANCMNAFHWLWCCRMKWQQNAQHMIPFITPDAISDTFFGLSPCSNYYSPPSVLFPPVKSWVLLISLIL